MQRYENAETQRLKGENARLHVELVDARRVVSDSATAIRSLLRRIRELQRQRDLDDLRAWGRRV